MRIIFYFFLVILLSAKGLFAGEMIVIADMNKKINVSGNTFFFVDSSNSMDINQIRELDNWVKPVIKKNSTINLGTSPYVHWFRFEVCNSTVNEDWIFQIDYPTLNEVVFYLFDETNALDTLMYSGKDYDKEYSYSVLFNHVLKANVHYTVYIRLRTESFIIMPISIMSPKVFIKNDRRNLTYLNTQYGILLALVLFNLILFALTRELNYILLTLYLGVLSLNAYYLYGYGYDAFPNLDPFLKSRMRQILFGLGSMLFIVFSIKYLDIKKYRRFLWGFQLLFLLSLVYTLLLFREDIPQRFFSRYSPILYLGGAMLNFLAGIHTFRKGERLAMYYVISFAFITLSSVV
jgi:two-component system, sensor histidine kinase LadS